MLLFSKNSYLFNNRRVLLESCDYKKSLNEIKVS